MVDTRFTIYGFGGGNYTRYAAEAKTREEMHKELDKALDQSYTRFMVNVEES